MGTLMRGGRIRRLTPRECFRLQGFSDELFDRASAVNSDAVSYTHLDVYKRQEKSIAAKQPYNKKYEQECSIFSRKIMETEKKSCRLSFQYDKERDEACLLYTSRCV